MTRRKSSVRCLKILSAVTWLSTLSTTSGKRLAKRKSIVIDSLSAPIILIIYIFPHRVPALFSLSEVIKTVTTSFNTDLELKEVRTNLSLITLTDVVIILVLNQLIAFRDQWADLLTKVARSTEQSIDRAKNNIIWMRQNYQKVVNWLQRTYT